MKQTRSLKQRLIASVLVLVMVFSSLIGTTFAWFTDRAASEGNVIQTGTLKVDLLHKTGDNWISVKDNPDHKVFDYDKWEPGYTRVETLKVANLGSLALKYKLSIEAIDGTAVTGANGENLADVIEVYVTYGETNESSYSDITSNDKWVRKGTLTEVLKAPASFMAGNLFPSGQYVEGSYGAVTGVGNQIVKIALHMKEDAGNEYQKLSIGDVSVNIVATQWTSESDSFDNNYDAGAIFPELNIGGITVDVQTANGVVTAPATISGEGVSGIIPAGVAVDSGVNKLGLSVTEKAQSDANLTLNDGEALRSLDVHMYGVSKNNTVPMLITVEQAMKPGLNIGNYTLYHLENGVTVAMTAVNTAADLDAHNEFYYDPATGDVTLAMATFSEVDLIAEKSAAWEGNFDYSWYDASKTELTIANADQLAAFGAIVGGMNGQTQDSFAGKTVKLIADINLGDKDDASTNLFYPIGYYNDAGHYDKDGTATAANVTSFTGTFDGNGHTISNFYQNTWQMWGNYDGNYYKAAMGLFGYVVNGTIKNLTVDNFSSDGEYTPTGVIAAYAVNSTFENIAITNCNPRVYNTGNGGIIGIAGRENAEITEAIVLRNITVDNSNKISALWGSYDVACGGLVGMYRGNVDASADTIHFENCHVSAQIDVYNDVCANYQYYAYRYAGMIIGSVRHNTTDENGKTIPNMAGITAANCTVNFGTWNDYYYCEIIDNTTASYTHDYQMSRLVEIKAIEGTTITYLDGKTGTVPASGRANYVIVDYSINPDVNGGHGTANATCYHFKDGKVWNHEDGGTEIVNGVEVLKEDKQHLYLEFNNLFTGYGWGVSTMAINNWHGITGIDVTTGDQQESVVKFEGKVNTLEDHTIYKLGDLFKFVNNGVKLVPDAINVSVTNINETNPVSATIVYDYENWENGTIILTGTGNVKITIQDYYFCTPTMIIVNVSSHAHTYDNACDTTCNVCGEEREITHTYDNDCDATCNVCGAERSITHNYTPAVTAPTCTEKGYTTYTCACGHSYVADETDALGHQYNTAVTLPTCTAVGYTTYTCSVCDYSYVADETAALGHQYNTAVTPPTCTAAGYTTYTCSACDYSYVADETTALGHTYNKTVVAPTCTAEGYTIYTCECGDNYKADYVGKTSHVEGATVVENDKKPTCTAEGSYDNVVYCTVCSEELSRETITVEALEHAFVFESKFNGDFLYRVGNQNTVPLSALFEIKNYDNISVSISDGVTGTYSNGEIQFTGTGLATVVVTDKVCEKSTTLYLEVVDATNVTGLSGTISGNVVLLRDCGLSSLTVSGRNTVYGNGFTATYTGVGQYLNNGLKQGVVTVKENGTLDNLRIVASIYPKAYLFYSEAQDGPKDVEGTKTRYHYQLSAVAATGNATISNCYIYGGRTNVYIGDGNVTVKDSVLECGTLANSQIISSSDYTVTFENVTTIQHQVNATVGTTTNVMMGAAILVGDGDKDTESPTAPAISLKGYFKQYNWVTSDDKNAISDSNAKMIIGGALDATKYNHTISGKTASNLGIIYLNDFIGEFDNQTGLPYESGNVSLKLSGVTLTRKVYSLKGATADQIYSDYENAVRTTVNGWYEPQFKYPTDLGGQYIEKTDDGDEFLYRDGDTIKVMFPSGDSKEIDLAALVNISKYTGQNLNLVITVKNGDGNAVSVTNGKVTLSAADIYTVTYTVTDTVFYDKDGKEVTNSIDYSWNISIDVALKETSIPNAYFEFDSTKQVIYRSGNSNIVQFIPFLAGLKIYDYNGQTAYLRFDGDKDFNKVAKATINNINTTGEAQGYHIVTIELVDGGKIVIDMDVRANTGSGTHSGSIKVRDNVLYVVNGGTTSGKGQTWKIYSYKFVGNNGTEINSGLVTFGTAGVDCGTASKPSSNFGTTVKYTVNYDANGGNCGQTLGYATSVSTAVTLPTPTRSGYIFAGWYTAASGGTRVGGAGDSYTPSANITLYAQWGKPCNVTYNANGGSCGTTSEKYTGTALTLPAPTRDGYWFIGWYDAAEGGNKIGDAGAKYNPSNEITLYAHWQEAIKYTVTYNANGGSCGTASATYEGNALTLPTPTKTGYKFLGWYTATSSGTKIGDAGATYVPSANITLYAQWQINSYTITVTTNNATVKVNGTTVNNNGTVSVQYGAQVTVEVTYSESNERSTTIKGTDGAIYTSPFTMPAQNVTINATSTGCVTPDTLITLADGTQVRVDSLKGDELLLVWNMETGKLDYAPIMFIDSDPEEEVEVIKLYFSDGTEVKVIYEHGFWDYDLNKYVYLDANAADYIGHTFAKQNGDTLEKVQLVDVVIETELTTAWSPVTVGHLCYFVNGMLSMPGGVGGLFNIFEVDAETMTYDYEQIAKDIETYGLFTYEELNAICPLTEEMFNAAGGAYLKISIGKGNLTMEELIYMINRYSKYI